MTRSVLKFVFLGVIALFVASCDRAESPTSNVKSKEAPVALKVPVAFPINLPGAGTTIKWIADRIEFISHGNMSMKIYEPGALVPAFEILDAVSTGKINAGYATAAYWTGKIPASSLFTGIPFGPEAGEYLAWLWYGNGARLYQEMYEQAGYRVKVLPCGIISPETGGWFSKEIDEAKDLKGLIMRFGGLGGQVMQRLGVSVSMIPAAETFPALEKNAIDATEYSMPAIDERLGFYKVVKYNYFPGWHQQATLLELLINQDTWDQMTEAQRMTIDVMCKAATADSFAYSEAIQFEAMKRNVEERGVIIKYWSGDMLTLFENTWYQLAEENALADPFFNKVWRDLEAFRKNYDIWEANAFLPRAKRPG